MTTVGSSTFVSAFNWGNPGPVSVAKYLKPPLVLDNKKKAKSSHEATDNVKF